MIRENRPVGVVSQPGHKFNDEFQTFGTGITYQDIYAQNKHPWSTFYMADQIQEMVRHIAEGWFQPGTIVVFRSTGVNWNPSSHANQALITTDDFAMQKVGMTMAHIGKIAAEHGVEMVWQWSNEIGTGSYEETLALCKFELERMRLVNLKGWGWKIGALATAVGNIGKPGYVKALVDSGFMEHNLAGNIWWLTHYYGVVVSEALMLDNQFSSKGSGQEAVAIALNSTGKENITASLLMETGPAFRVMEHLMYPETRDANILVTEWHYYDKARDRQHEIPYGDTDGRGHRQAWAFINKHSPNAYPNQYGFILSELNFIARLAYECPGEVHILAWTFGSGTKGNWRDFDWLFEAAYKAYVNHVLMFIETVWLIDEPEPTPPEPTEPTPEPEPLPNNVGEEIELVQKALESSREDLQTIHDLLEDLADALHILINDQDDVQNMLDNIGK